MFDELEVEKDPEAESDGDSWESLLKTQYWCAFPAETFADAVEERFQEHQESYEISGLASVIRRSYRMHHSMDPSQSKRTQFAPEFVGEEGEQVYTEVNHYRNHILHQKALIIPEKFAFQPQAKTSDAEALEQVDIANALLDHAVEVRGVGSVLHEAVERCIVESAAWIRLGWDAEADDVVAEHLGVLDVAFQNRRRTDESEWVIARTFDSRWRLAAEAYNSGDEEMAKAIVNAGPVRDHSDSLYSNDTRIVDDGDSEDMLEVLHVYIPPSPQLPEGRYAVVVRSEGLVIEDGPYPFAGVPCHRMAPSKFVGTSVPYSSAWDLMPLQMLENACISAIITRMEAFGVPNVAYEEGTEVSIGDSGLAMWAYRPGGAAPSVIDMMPANSSLHQIVSMLETLADKISGINSVNRGQPADNINSGSFAALVEVQATKFNGPIGEAVTTTTADVATSIIRLYQSHCTAAKTLALTGKDGQRRVEEFQADKVSKVLRVTVERTNPLTKTHAWKQDAAQQLLQMRPEVTPQEYLHVVKTGDYQSMTDDPVARRAHIEEENARMIRGEEVRAIDYERHDEHFRLHAAKLDSRLREGNQEAAAALTKHCIDHLTRWKQLTMMDPAALKGMGMGPAPIPGMPGGAPPGAPQGAGGKPGPAPAPGGKPPNPGDRMPKPAAPAKPKE